MFKAYYTVVGKSIQGLKIIGLPNGIFLVTYLNSICRGLPFGINIISFYQGFIKRCLLLKVKTEFKFLIICGTTYVWVSVFYLSLKIK